MPSVLSGQKRGLGSLGRVTGGCEPLMEAGNLNTGPLQEQWVPLTAEPPLQP